MDISTTRHLRHGRRVRGSGENDSGKNLPRLFFGKKKTLPPIVGALSTMPVKKYGLELLNPLTSAQEKYLISQRGSAELVRVVTGGGAFSDADHLWTLGEERHDRKKD